MVQQLKILNSKEIKELHQKLEQQFGFAEKLDVVFMLSEKKERIYIFNRDLANFDLSRLRVDSMGLYFGSYQKEQFRLTIEGSQMIGPRCTRNILEIDKKEMQAWLQGEQLPTPEGVEPGAFLILKHGNDYLGCGKVAGETILNYIPKTRYIHALYEDMDDVPNAPGESLPPSSG